MHHHMEHGDGGMGIMPALLGASWAVFLLALAVGTLFLLHRRGLLPTHRLRALVAAPAGAGEARSTVGVRSEAEQFLDMALAKGEIDVAEYHERRSALRSVDL